jgi:hypothetical protein
MGYEKHTDLLFVKTTNNIKTLSMYNSMASLNIVELIEKNPITKLSDTYNNRFLTKIKEKFNETDQQLFLASFYCFLNYQKNDFVINLDNIWEWLGFTQKVSAKRVLEKNVVLDKDYKRSVYNLVNQEKTHGGGNKEKFMLNVKTFKLLCLKSGTKKADQIHEYYINLEETLQDVIQEETDELKNQLERKEIQIQTRLSIAEEDKVLLREKTILE